MQGHHNLIFRTSDATESIASYRISYLEYTGLGFLNTDLIDGAN